MRDVYESAPGQSAPAAAATTSGNALPVVF